LKEGVQPFILGTLVSKDTSTILTLLPQSFDQDPSSSNDFWKLKSHMLHLHQILNLRILVIHQLLQMRKTKWNSFGGLKGARGEEGESIRL